MTARVRRRGPGRSGLQHAKFVADARERVDGTIQVLACVCRGDLRADARGPADTRAFEVVDALLARRLARWRETDDARAQRGTWRTP